MFSIFKHVNLTKGLPSLQSVRALANINGVHRLSRGKNSLAYRVTTGNSPGIIFLPGYLSNMDGIKATALHEFCTERQLAYTRFDYQGCGLSGGDIMEATLTTWKDDVLTVIDQITAGPQILVGSSMGGLLMILTAMKRSHRIHSLVGIATVADMAGRRLAELSSQQLQLLEQEGQVMVDSVYGPQPLTWAFLQDSKQYNLLSEEPIPLTCPVTLIHGMQDEIVPYETSVKLAEKMSSRDVEVILKKHGDHRMSQHSDIKLLSDTLDKLIYERKELRQVAAPAYPLALQYINSKWALEEALTTSIKESLKKESQQSE